MAPPESGIQPSSDHRPRLILLLAAACAALAYARIFGAFFPNRSATIGHDYSSFFPMLLEGYYWHLENGWWAVPWFSPAFCGGVPNLPNPESVHYSVPQLLALWVDPMGAVFLTMLLFAGVGFCGSYLLARRLFTLDRPLAFLVAVIFAFNGFFSHRLIVGHLTFHPIMLVPGIAWLLFAPTRAPRTRAVIAGVAMGYMAIAGMVNGILPAGLAIAMIGALAVLLNPTTSIPWRRPAIALPVAFGLAAFKLAAAAAFMGTVPRTAYPLPGLDGLVSSIALPLRALFFGPPNASFQAALQNSRWAIERHELEYSVTWLPLLLVVIGAFHLGRGLLEGQPPARSRRRRIALLTLALLGALPILLNIYQPTWNGLLKALPIIGSSSSLVRLWASYIPIAAIAAAVAIQHTPWLRAGRRPLIAAATGAIAVIAIHAFEDSAAYHAPGYPPQRILRAYHEAKTADSGPPITFVGVYRDAAGEAVRPLARNDLLAAGGSQLLCHQPVFGYRLENFPRDPLRIGPVLESQDGLLNLKNPACFVYPEANGCQPGDHFGADQGNRAARFAARIPYHFETGWTQSAANVLSLLTLLTLAAAAIVAAARRAHSSFGVR